MDWLSTRRFPLGRRYSLGLSGAIALVLLAVTGTAMGAVIVDADTYHLRQGEVVQDDLVVVGRDVIIDGTVEGDLVAFGASVVVNGIVTEDVIAAGAEIQINGVVQDDVRIAGAALQINGTVGDDLFAAGGSYLPAIGAIPVTVGDRTVVSGIRTGPTASVGGNGYLVGGVGTLEGVFRNDLFAAINMLVFNARVDGDADLTASNVTFGESAYVAGDLNYSVSAESGTPEAGGVITRTEAEEEAVPAARPQRRPLVGFGWWLLRTVLMAIGTALVAVIILQLSRRRLTLPADAIQAKPVEAGLYGVLAAVAVFPLSAAVIFLAFLFWGWYWGGVATFAFLFGLFTLAWVLSPVVTGLWLGRLLFASVSSQRGDFYAILAGASIIVFTGRILGAIPCVGALAYLLVYLLSFALAAGGILLSSRRADASAEA
jgi:cytoskeletal protein CcmA (bactofilin family)